MIFNTLKEAWDDYVRSPEAVNVKDARITDLHEAFKAGFARGNLHGDIGAQARAWQIIYDKLLALSPQFIDGPGTGIDKAMARLEYITASGALTPGQQSLKEAHGTLEEFTDACINAIGEISVAEARRGIAEYHKKWREA